MWDKKMAYVSTPTGSTVDRGPASAAEPDSVFDPTSGLVGILWRAIYHNEDVRVSRGDSEGIVLIPSSRQYIQFTTDLERFCGGDLEEYTVTCLDKQYRAQFDRGTRLARCMHDLLWHAGLYGSRGRLIAGCGRYDVVKLTRWPNLTRVEATPNAVTIAALLSRHPTNINLARSLTGVDADEINAFCSAAFAARSLEILSRVEAAVEPVLEPHRERSVLAKILNRLRGH